LVAGTGTAKQSTRPGRRIIRAQRIAGLRQLLPFLTAAAAPGQRRFDPAC
jgi:hypothetical protein